MGSSCPSSLSEFLAEQAYGLGGFLGPARRWTPWRAPREPHGARQSPFGPTALLAGEETEAQREKRGHADRVPSTARAL